MKTAKSLLLCTVVIVILSSCSKQQDNTTSQSGRWYSAAQVTLGKQVFADNCSVCHGKKAEGIVDDWRQPLSNGKYPPPPLNGSAHAWHHPMSVLLQTINKGGAPFGGQMPAFEDKLSQEEKLAAIAFFQHFWTEEVYQQWLSRDGLK